MKTKKSLTNWKELVILYRVATKIFWFGKRNKER